MEQARLLVVLLVLPKSGRSVSAALLAMLLVTHPKQRELCWCVALVVSAVALSLLPVMPGPGGGQPVVSDNPEKKTKFNKPLDHSMQAPSNEHLS